MFPKTHTLRPYPPSVTVFGDGASRKLLGLDEVMRMGPNDGLVPFFRRDTTKEFALPLIRYPAFRTQRGLVSTQGDGAIYSQKEFSPGTKLVL